MLNTHKKKYPSTAYKPDKKTVQIINPETQQIDVIGEKTAERYAVIKALLQTNVKQSEIAKLTDYTPEHISRLKKKLLNIQLVTPKRIKKAIKAVEHFANVENYQEDKRIKPADVINASRIFLDRQYPENKINLEIDNSQKINNIQINFIKKPDNLLSD